MTDTSQTLIEALDDGGERRNERREFFKTAFAATAIAGAGAVAIGVAERAAAADTDADVLNFVLNLEYLAANYFAFAVNGSAISPDLVSGSGTTGSATGGKKVGFTDTSIQAFAREILSDEIGHINFLRDALGSSVVAQPTIDLTPAGAFTTLATKAGVITSGTFDPYASDNNFLLGAYLIKDVIVSAYKGVATTITTRVYLEALAGVLGTESYHAATIRGALYSRGATTASLRTNADKFSDARDALDGSSDLDQGISPTTPSDGSGSAANITPTDANGVYYSRSTGQALNVLYVTDAAATKGGFFPNGVNGTVNTSADSAA